MPVSFLDLAVGSSAATTAWNTYLQYRQSRAFTTPYDRLRVELRGLTDPQKFERAQAYSADKARFAIWSTVFDGVVEIATLKSGVLPRLWDAVGASRFINNAAAGGFMHCWMWGVAVDVLDKLIHLPWGWYANFRLEARHGFNRMTLLEFAKDQLKTMLLNALLLRPLLTGLVHVVVTKFGPHFPLYLTAASGVAIGVAMFLIPNLIMPLFNKFTPLPADHPVRLRIEALARRVSFPLKALFEIDGSRRSSHSNAFFYGFGGNKRIVLYDTLLHDHKDTPDEIEAVVAHELGHWQMSHVPKNFVLTLANLTIMFYGAAHVVFNEKLYRDFGFRDTMNPNVGIALFAAAVWTPVQELTHILMAHVSRRFEFQADAYAARLGYRDALKRGLVSIHDKNASSLTPDWLYSACRYSHPPLAERLAALDSLAVKRE
jgi:STE24 endopeptidase